VLEKIHSRIMGSNKNTKLEVLFSPEIPRNFPLALLQVRYVFHACSLTLMKSPTLNPNDMLRLIGTSTDNTRDAFTEPTVKGS
jgi:hypothetical protein